MCNVFVFQLALKNITPVLIIKVEFTYIQISVYISGYFAAVVGKEQI